MSQTATRAGATVATEPQIRPLDILNIEPEAIIARDQMARDSKESYRRGREFSVYRVNSRSEDTARTVVYNDKAKTIYCDCPAGQRGIKCAHVKSVLFHRTYGETFRLYHTATLAELQEQDRDLARMERGTLVPIRGWRAIKAAIGDLILDLTQEAA